jgi:tripartite-type tricarboxylate transporter receptor subunit TctC
LKRRNLLAAALAWGGSVHAVDALSQTETYPTRPIKVVVPFAPGGAGDGVARIVGSRAQRELGQAVIIENKSGGNSLIGTQFVARAKPDGYTLLQTTASNVIVANLQAHLPFDPDKDFLPVVGVGAVPLGLVVNANSSLRSVADLIALAKSNPQGVFYSSGGSGSQTHLAPVWFAQEAKIAATHIAFRGGGPAAEAVLANQVQFTFASTVAVDGLVKAGQLRVLAVTSDHRVRSMPDVPTMAEQGFPDFTPMLWYGYVVPANTPKNIIDRLHVAFAAAANDPGVQERLEKLGLSVTVRGPAEFDRFIREESARWRRVIQENHIKID